MVSHRCPHRVQLMAAILQTGEINRLTGVSVTESILWKFPVPHKKRDGCACANSGYKGSGYEAIPFPYSVHPSLPPSLPVGPSIHPSFPFTHSFLPTLEHISFICTVFVSCTTHHTHNTQSPPYAHAHSPWS